MEGLGEYLRTLKQMRILVISNFYPPYYKGGYELACQEMVEAFKARGHQMKVLTSTYGVDSPQINGDVYRWFRMGRGSISWISDCFFFRRLLRSFKPDLIYVWNLRGISASFVFLAQRMKFAISYFVFDHWLAEPVWEDDFWDWLWHHRSKHFIIRAIKAILSPFGQMLGLIPSGELDLRHVQFASEYLRGLVLKAGKTIENCEVIPWGINIKIFPFREISSGPNRLLYVGQIISHKGIHTAIEAMRILIARYGLSNLTLTLVGGQSGSGGYEAQIHQLVNSYGLKENVHFAGFTSREYLPKVYSEHDILVFPSVWDEPFGIVLLEAMACGLAVVSTATGGNKEFLIDGENCLIFPPNDYEALSNRINRLISDPHLRKKLFLAGRKMVEERFDIRRTIDKLEESLNVNCAYPGRHKKCERWLI